MNRRTGLRFAVLLFALLLTWLYYSDTESPLEPSETSKEAQTRDQSKESSAKPKLPKHPKLKAVKVDPPSPAEQPLQEQAEPEAEPVPSPSPAPPLGAMSRASIDEGIQGVLDEVDECYREALEEVPDLEGMIRARFTIRGDDGVGRVIRISIKDADFDDAPLEDCLLDAIEEVEFPPPEGGGIVIVTYPFVFTPQ